ncbi:ISAon1 family transposase N-terminal region protein [Sphingobacterium cavernae]
MRGQQVYLHVKRRRWLNQDTGKVVYRDWNLVAKGTRVTSDFAAFLKGISG